jgi:hypothetical protein
MRQFVSLKGLSINELLRRVADMLSLQTRACYAWVSARVARVTLVA